MERNEIGLRAMCGEAFRKNIVPGVIIQAFALSILGAYYFLPDARWCFEAVGAWKREGGLWFSSISTALFAGAIPFGVMLFLKRIPPGAALSHGTFFICYWAVQGVLVDLLYTWQGVWFGHGNDVATLAKKVAMDQGPFNLILFTNLNMLFYLWKEKGFSWRAVWGVLDRRSYFIRYIKVQIACWTVWIPAVTIIYSLPAELQVPMFNLVLCFYTLVLAVLTSEGARA